MSNLKVTFSRVETEGLFGKMDVVKALVFYDGKKLGEVTKEFDYLSAAEKEWTDTIKDFTDALNLAINEERENSPVNL